MDAENLHPTQEKAKQASLASARETAKRMRMFLQVRFAEERRMLAALEDAVQADDPLKAMSAVSEVVTYQTEYAPRVAKAVLSGVALGPATVYELTEEMTEDEIQEALHEYHRGVEMFQMERSLTNDLSAFADGELTVADILGEQEDDD